MILSARYLWIFSSLLSFFFIYLFLSFFLDFLSQRESHDWSKTNGNTLYGARYIFLLSKLLYNYSVRPSWFSQPLIKMARRYSIITLSIISLNTDKVYYIIETWFEFVYFRIVQKTSHTITILKNLW